ncbi:hypothetical protein MLD38_035666 [Melastoma candidum]|uniref:Uncharacterized protein n=1 Tax=Melastoma candidum TaxID=119954 RepID=A0ACB9LGS2_9MYRT|nr:hypothetical protein MLD38_035666 [Melastoma candidum]
MNSSRYPHQFPNVELKVTSWTRDTMDLLRLTGLPVDELIEIDLIIFQVSCSRIEQNDWNLFVLSSSRTMIFHICRQYSPYGENTKLVRQDLMGRDPRPLGKGKLVVLQNLHCYFRRWEHHNGHLAPLEMHERTMLLRDFGQRVMRKCPNHLVEVANEGQPLRPCGSGVSMSMEVPLPDFLHLLYRTKREIRKVKNRTGMEIVRP